MKRIRHLSSIIIICLLCVLSLTACRHNDTVSILSNTISEVLSTDSLETSPEAGTEVENEVTVSEEPVEVISASEEETKPEAEEIEYRFRNKKRLNEHYEKHGIEMGFEDAESYEAAASRVVNNPDALHKIEKEDGDDVYYLEETNEFVVVSTDGYLRTYFCPDSGKKYFDKQ